MNRTDAAEDFRPRGARGYDATAGRILGYVFTGVWLLYLIGPVVDLFTGHYSALYTWGGIAVIGLFSAVYLIVVPRCPGWPCSPCWPPSPASSTGGWARSRCGSSCRPPPGCWLRTAAGRCGPRP